MQPKKCPSLLLLTSSYPRSGDDQTSGYIREFARRLSREFDVTVLTLPDPGADDEDTEPLRVKRARCLLPDRLNPLLAGSDLNGIRSRGLLSQALAGYALLVFFLQACRVSLRADIICSHWLLPSGLIGAILSRLLGKPHLAIEHSGALHLLRRMRGGRRIAGFIARGAGRVIVVSRDLEAKLLNLCPEAKGKTEVVPMGIESSLVPRRRNGGRSSEDEGTSTPVLRLLFLGRLVEIKGVQVLLRSLENRRDVQLYVAGDGEKRGELEWMARELNVDVTFLGRVGRAEKARLLTICDAVVIPSLVMPGGRTEGLPVVALEALAAGLPLLASRVGGLSEIIEDGHNGLHFEAGDHRMLAERIEQIAGDRRLLMRLSANARAAASSYDWSRIGGRYIEICRTLLRTNGTSKPHQASRGETV